MATTVGTIQLIAKIDTSQYKKGASEVNKANSDMESSGTKSGSRLGSAFTKVAKVGLAALAAAAVAVGVAITKNIGAAVNRVDTLNNFPKVLKAMGQPADAATKATKRLADSLTGLPTTLDEGTQGVQQFVAAGLGVNKATSLFLAMNNALIAGGANAADTQIAMDGMVRAISSGQVPSSTLVAMLSRMPTVMSALTKSTGKSRDQLQKLYQTNPNKLIDDMIRLNQKGGGGLQSLDKQARNATGGIGTSFDLMNTAITRGIAKVITAIGSKNISNAITGIGKALEGVLGVISSVIGYLPTLASWFEKNKTAIQNIAIVIGTLLLPMLVQLGVQGVRNIILYTAATIAAGVQSLIAGARMAAGWLLAMGPIGLIIAAVVGAVALIIANWGKVSGFVTAVWTKIKSAAASVFNWLKKNWPLVLAIITGPIGLAVLAIVKNFSKIKSAVGSVWNWIKTTLGTIGKVAANIIKVPVNAILGFAQNTINGFIRALNGVIGIINKIPKVELPKIGTLKLPRLADGGIVTSPTIAEIGEAGPEAVIPLSKLDKMINGNDNSNNQGKVRDVTYNVYPKSEIDMNVINRQFLWELNRA